MRLFQAALGTCLDNPFFASLSVHGLHFTVYATGKITAVVLLIIFGPSGQDILFPSGRCQLRLRLDTDFSANTVIADHFYHVAEERLARTSLETTKTTDSPVSRKSP